MERSLSELQAAKYKLKLTFGEFTSQDIRSAILTAADAIDELSEYRNAQAEGRMIRIPSENDETIRMVETALQLKLYDWQKAYILGLADYVAPGRCTDKTLAHIIRLCLSKGTPIEGYKNIPVDAHHGPQYQEWYARQLEDIYFKLQKQHPWLKLRVIKFYRSDRRQHRCDLINGHQEIWHNSYGDAAAGVETTEDYKAKIRRHDIDYKEV